MSRIKETTGSIMIAALIVALITGALVGLFLKTVTQEVEYSYRSRMAFQAVNLAEAGIDYAIYAFINDSWTADGWTTKGDGHYRTTFTALTNPALQEYELLGTNETYGVKVYAQNGDPGSDIESELPVVVAEGNITLSSGATVTRQIMVRLQYGADDNPSNGGFWGNGILSKRGLDFGGQKQSIDSFSSSNNPLGYTHINDIYADQTTTTILGHELARGYGSVASKSVNVSDISVGNADIFGSLGTGAAQEGTDITSVVGPNGSIYNHESEKADLSDNIDHGYISYDFWADIPDATNPTLVGAETTYGVEIGQSGVSTEYELTEMNLKNNEVVTVKGDVTMVIDGDMTIKGELVLEEGATLELYVTGDMDVGGNGIVNTGRPPDLLIFNTGTNTEIKLHGNGFVSAAVYAPNSTVSLRGGGGEGEMYGAIVGDSVTFSGNNYEFHYDEDLANLALDDDDPNDDEFVPEVYSWVELTDASDRKNMTTILNDGI
ncbi:MAG: hypothetical protein AB3N63_16015 [Puniceicoccaceae bacterium]